ncbi:hypothetical protein CAEBREN_01095 [Caenorhabditis brenneri]|uniref:F-box domain-containing protein n=1 Tax=Caenorhabditis brenneri TaxID=135651 RepID=G0NEU6_CAEBE|nr:hypothetical protein CAEBREN_01095 [Caenorhabditis brenneri]
MTNLYNLTADPMRCILEYLKMDQILNLRKVSWNIQNTIDEINPNFNIRRLYISQNSPRIILTIFTDRYRTIKYKDGQGFPKGCYVNTKKNEVFVENGNFIDVFARDLEIILNNRKSVLEQFRIKLGLNDEINNKLMTAISTGLESNLQQLKAKELEMNVTNQAQIYEVFRCINPEKLELIKLSKPGTHFDSVPLEINGACELEQWNHTEILEMKGLIVPDIHHNFTHFKRFEVKVNKITPDDLLFLKENLKKSLNFEEAIVWYVSFNDSERLSQLFPEFQYNKEADNYCIFKFSDTNRYLGFKLFPYWSIVIKTLDESEVTDWFVNDVHIINE